MNIYISSLGCDKNLCDAEHMLKILSDAGYAFTDAPEEADVILVNTCCFIGDAKEESIQEILSLSRMKTEGVLKALVVTGCLAERYQDELEKELPEIDGCLGVTAWDRVAEVVGEALEGRHPHVFLPKDRLCESVPRGRIVSSGGYYAYLKIAEGCSKNCAYCVIPKVRGPYRSVPMEHLLSEAAALAGSGVRELILVAQETTLYGTDLYGRRALPELLAKLSETEGIRWIRLLYCYPEEITDELVQVLAENDRVVPYLDIPVQHASDRILKAMNRRTRKEEILSKIRLLRARIPGIALRTSLITGFP
ncbi:MAG: MiaB/RimO family radical SAM methylthiotransferase, partial [Lachnospiraceae bacterium]|nr:MiaB/RimO family radical SAM methylthiotransferase [Lachnospiraceae bacterium]